MKKIILSIFFLLAFFPNLSSAAVGYSQTVTTASPYGVGYSAPYTLGFYLQIPGTYFSSDFVGETWDTVTVSVSGSGTTTFGAEIRCYTNAGYTTPCSGTAVYTKNVSTGLASMSYVNYVQQINFSGGFVIDPTKYYRVNFYGLNGYTGLNFGANGSLSNPFNCIYYFTTTQACTSSGATYLVLSSSDLSGSSRVTAISSPLANSTVSSPVSFSFTYFNDGSEGYDRAGIELINLTDGSSLYVPSQSITSTGNSSFNASIQVSSDAYYNWRPFLSDGTNFTYGSVYQFQTGTLMTPLPIPDDPNDVGFIQKASEILRNALSFINGTSSSNTTGTTTDSELRSSGNAVVTGATRVTYKFPFSYFYDSLVLLDDLNAGFDSGSTTVVAWDYSYGPATTSLVIIDRDTIADLSIIVYLRSFLAMALWISWAMAVAFFVIKLLKSIT
ncbi:MAG: hypothetical protein [Inoviridae sp.]|nr:MAG: hypothetical protein [Inoviridae sp.]